MCQQIFPKLSGFKDLQFFLMSLDAAHHMGHAATKPDKVNIGITKDFGDQ